jgi:hypothetical protein
MDFDNFIIGKKRRGKERGELAKNGLEFRVPSFEFQLHKFRV